MENNFKASKPKNDNWNIGRIFWGLLLVLIGGMLVADNFGWLNVNWGDLWRLWPLVIIAIGVSILSVKGIVWKIFTIVLAAVTLGAIAFVALGNYSGPNVNHDIKIDKNGVHIQF